MRRVNKLLHAVILSVGVAVFYGSASLLAGENQLSESGDSNGFYPKKFERSYVMQISGSPTEACALMADRSKGELLFDGFDGGKTGEIYYSNAHNHRSWTLVVMNDMEGGFYSELRSLPDEKEFLLMDVQCVKGASGGTSMTVRWRLTGIDDEGNEAIQTYFDKGMFEQRFTRAESRINDKLARQKGKQ
jgi:hypothetical protein